MTNYVDPKVKRNLYRSLEDIFVHRDPSRPPATQGQAHQAEPPPNSGAAGRGTRLWLC